MHRTQDEPRRRRARVLAVATALALSVGAGATAQAQTGGVEQGGDSGSETEQTSGDDTTRVALRRADVSPQKHVFDNGGRAYFRYRFSAKRRLDVKVEIVRKSNGRVVKSFRRNGMTPNELHRVGWNGQNFRRHPANVSLYFFRVRRVDNGRILRANGIDGKRWTKLYWNAFPVRGPHSYGDSIGAPRSGHTHQGQDIFARCGAPIVAARGGIVQYRGYQGGGAGYYVVIDGFKTGMDYVYMHLARRVLVKAGQRVRTGQRIGWNGATGNASGCHLHFELWSAPGWYEGGTFLNPTPKMRYWDSYS